jgi:hypothetical protein
MTALSMFLVLLAIFLSASYANAFASLSPVAENQVWGQSFVDNARSQLIDSWQCQMEINKVKSEPFASCSTNQIKQDKSTATFKLVVASVLNNVLVDLWQCRMEIGSTNNLVGFCHDKNQSKLETVLLLNSWASATIKNQRELGTFHSTCGILPR